jgi:membrane protein DedA with SNARE-associated domain
MLADIVKFIVDTVAEWGYIGIFIMMFLESSFFPFPSEVAMIPAGYLASTGEMNLFIAIVTGIAGSLAGALFNYFLAVKYGRGFLIKFGKYFFITEETIDKVEHFFQDHGHISTFSGRLIPAVRQYISFPAGLARMNLKEFSLYTALGAGIWTTILVLLGYFLGKNEDLIHQYTKEITILVLIILSIGIGFYIYKHKKKS